jgi:branched-chain amino acid transport system substrate-binding protein
MVDMIKFRASKTAITKMQAIVIAAIVIIAAVIGAWYVIYVLPTPSGAAGSITVGVIGSMTGVCALYGEELRYATEIALEEINAKGGVLGRNVSAVYGDDESGSIEKGITVLNDMISSKVVAVTGQTFTTVAVASLPVVEQAKMPFIVCDALATNVPPSVSPWAFWVHGNMSSYGYGVAKWMSEMNITRYAVVRDDSWWGAGISDDIDSSFSMLGYADNVTCVDIEISPTGTSDFFAQGNRLKDLAPQMIVIMHGGTSAYLAVKQFRELGIRSIFMGTDAVFELSDFDTVAGAAANLCLHRTEFPYELPLTPLASTFAAKFESKFGHYPSATAACQYSGLLALFDAIQKAGSTDPDKIRSALRETNLLAALPTKVIFDPVTQENTIETIVCQRQNGTIVAIWPKQYAQGQFIPMSP